MLIHMATEVLFICDTILFVRVWLYSRSSRIDKEIQRAVLITCMTTETTILRRVEEESS